MSDNIDTAEVTTVLESIKDNRLKQISWAYFVIAARPQIITSAPDFGSSAQLRKFWLLKAKTIASKLGYTLNTGIDTWYLIEEDLHPIYRYAAGPSESSSTTETSSKSTTTVDTAKKPVSPKSPNSGSSKTSSEIQLATESTTSTSEAESVKLPSLTSADKDSILAVYDALDSKKMWKLSTGTIVEEKMRECALNQTQEHLSHSLIFNTQDTNWLKYFSEEEIQEIRDYNSVELPAMPQELQAYLNELAQLNHKDLLARITQAEFELESDCKWAQDTIYQAVRLIRSGFFDTKGTTEGGLTKRVWSCIDACFDFSPITCISGEKCSSSSADAMNANRSSLASRQSSGRKMDYLFLDAENEIGCGECGLAGGANSTKELYDAMFKLPKVMKDMLIKLVSASPSLKKDLIVTGLYIGERKLKLTLLDCPSHYVTRYDSLDDVWYPKNEKQLYRRLSSILEVLIGARILMETTADKLAADTTKITVGKSKLKSKAGDMVPCFVLSDSNKRRKRKQ